MKALLRIHKEPAGRWRQGLHVSGIFRNSLDKPQDRLYNTRCVSVYSYSSSGVTGRIGRKG